MAFAMSDAVAEELREELDVRGLAAPGAGARELEERLEELGALHVESNRRAVRFGQVEEESEVVALGVAQGLLGRHVERLVLRVRLVLRGAHGDAEAAARAVLRRDLDRVGVPLVLGALERDRLVRSGRARELRRLEDLRADRGVRAHHRALVALDADLLVPHGDLESDVPLLPLGGGEGPRAVGRERAHGQEVALSLEHDARDALHEVRRGVGHDGRAAARRRDLHGDGHLGEVREGPVDGREIAAHRLLALPAVRLLDRLLDLGDGLLAGQDARDREEAGLHDRVDAAAHSERLGDLVGVDDEDLELLLEDLLLHLEGKLVPRLGGPVLRVQEEDGARRGRLEHVVAVEERLLVARDEVRAPHEVRRPDRLRPEAQVRDGDGARLLRVVHEVALREVVRLLADDLDRVLVRAHGAVGAEAVEEGAHRAGRLDVELRVPRERRVRHVVHDADREVVLRFRFRELVEDGLHHARRELLGRKAVAAAQDERLVGEGKRVAAARFDERGHDVEIERIADRARLLRPVEDGERLHGLRERREERRNVERPEEPHLQDADFLALGDEMLDGLVGRFGARAHEDDDARRLGMADVVEEVVRAPRELREAVHLRLHVPRAREVVDVSRLARLEERVGVLRAAAEDRAVRGEAAAPVLGDRLLVEHRQEILVRQLFDLRDLVRGAEPVEEVEKGDPRLQARGLRDDREVVRFLDRVGREEREPRLAAGHGVGVVAEDGERVRRDRPRGHVHHERRQLARDLVHVRNHEEEALRRRERRGEGARLDRAVDRARGAALGLHLDDFGDVAPDVLLALRGPLVGPLAHVGGGRDGVDRDDVVGAVRDRGHGLIAIQREKSARHESLPFSTGRPGDHH